MMSDDDNSIDDLLGDFEPDPAHIAKIRRSMRCEIADLPAIDHGNLARPLSIAEAEPLTDRQWPRQVPVIDCR